MNKTFLSSLMLLAACGVNEVGAEAGDAPQVNGEAALRGPLSPPAYYFTDGASVTDVATGAAFKVSSFVSVDPALDEVALKTALAAPGDAILFGKVSSGLTGASRRGVFEVSGAWRALPGVLPVKYGGVYAAAPVSLNCFADPCPTLELTELNGKSILGVDGVNLARTLKAYVDEPWLQEQIRAGRTLLAGEQTGKGLGFDAAALYLRLPERVQCAQIRPPNCSLTKRSEPTFIRSGRCTFFDQCVTPGPCPANFVLPTCEKGYREVRFNEAPNACERLICEPDFFE